VGVVKQKLKSIGDYDIGIEGYWTWWRYLDTYIVHYSDGNSSQHIGQSFMEFAWEQPGWPVYALAWGA
jgi:hypothetical protein